MKCNCCGNDKYPYKEKNGRIKYHCKLCNKHRIRTKNRIFKQKCVEYKGGKCSNCGYDKCIAALDFHHIDKSTKDFSISSYTYRDDFDSIKTELDKCVILCSNCHREEHFYNEKSFNYEKNIKKTKCIDCGIITKNYTIRCLKCNNKHKKRNIPSKIQLEKDLNEFNHNLSAIGRKYSVSDSAVRKWIKLYK